jgi:hypothetical protein
LLENLDLRQQLAVLARKQPRSRVGPLLDSLAPALAAVAQSAPHRAAFDSRSLASQGIQAVLEMDLAAFIKLSSKDFIFVLTVKRMPFRVRMNFGERQSSRQPCER